ncbi:MAG: hypothetical protein AAF357_04700 [Verrucomicrobiota bacterium]
MPKRKRSKGRSRRRVNPLVVVLITCGTLLVLLVVGLLGVRMTIQSWLKGDGFKSWLVSKASTTLQADVELADFGWHGSEVYTDRFVAEGYETAGFSRMELNGIRAKAGGIRDGAFRIPEARINRLDLVFSDDRRKRPPTYRDEESEIKGPEIPDWLRRYVPDRAEVDAIEVAAAKVSVLDATGASAFTLAGTEAVIQPDFSTAMWEIQGKGGTISLPEQPVIDLKSLAMRWQGDELFIDQCALGIYADGHVDGTGEIRFGDDGNFDLDLNLSSIRIDELVAPEWQERFDGIIEGPVRVTGSPGAFTYEGTMRVNEGVVESVPVLSLIAEYTRNDQFKRITLSEAVTDFESDGETIKLTNLVLQSDGLVRVEGSATIIGEVITGGFQVGVTPGTLRWIPGAERSVFIEQRDGFLWTSMNLTGTLSDPKEDLSGRLVAAAGAEILNALPDGLLKEAQKFLGTGSPTESANPDGGRDIQVPGGSILDLITPFLGQ